MEIDCCRVADRSTSRWVPFHAELRSNFDAIIKRMQDMENLVTGAVQGEEITREFQTLSAEICGHVRDTNARATDKEAAERLHQQQQQQQQQQVGQPVGRWVTRPLGSGTGCADA